MKACILISVFTVFIFGGNCLHWESFYVICSILLYKERQSLSIFSLFVLSFVFFVLSIVCLNLGVTDSAVRVFMWRSILGYKERLCFFHVFMLLCFVF